MAQIEINTENGKVKRDISSGDIHCILDFAASGDTIILFVRAKCNAKCYTHFDINLQEARYLHSFLETFIKEND